MTLEAWIKAEEDKLKRFIIFWRDGQTKHPQFFPKELEHDGDWQEHFDIWCATGEPTTHEEAKSKNMYYYEGEDE